jgi:hypothetical protein
VAGSFEYGNESLGFIKTRDFLYYLSDCLSSERLCSMVLVSLIKT